MSAAQTVRVRIAVKVNDHGQWFVQAMSACDDPSAYFPSYGNERFVVVEADIPRPEPLPVLTIEGTVRP